MSITKIVLQGEFAVVKGDENPHTLIKTSKATVCNVVVLSHPLLKIGVLAHFDDYTSIIHGFHKIDKHCKNIFNSSINDSSFEAQIYGSLNEDCYSLKQRDLIKSTLKTTYNIYCSNIIQKFPPQLLFDPKEGSVVFLRKKKEYKGSNLTKKRINALRPEIEKNVFLEALQRREYYEWNRILDKKYSGVKGEDIPEFKIKEATRFEHELPNMSDSDLKIRRKALSKLYPLEHTSIMDTIDKLERIQEIRLDLRVERKLVIKSEQEVVEKINSILASIELSKKDRKFLNKSLSDKNYNLLVRLIAADSRAIKVLTYILKKKECLGIDLNARGQKSGTALDVALRHNNSEAIELLSR